MAGPNSAVSDQTRRCYAYEQIDGSGVWGKPDWGQTWTGKIGGGFITGQLGIGRDGTLFSGGISGPGLGFWRSEKASRGRSWTRYTIAGLAADRTDVYPPVVDPYDKDHLLIPGHEQDYLGESFDGGRNWNTITLPSGMLVGA